MSRVDHIEGKILLFYDDKDELINVHILGKCEEIFRADQPLTVEMLEKIREIRKLDKVEPYKRGVLRIFGSPGCYVTLPTGGVICICCSG